MKNFFITKENMYVNISENLINEYNKHNGIFNEEVANYLYETSESLNEKTPDNVKKAIEDSMMLMISVYNNSSVLAAQLEQEGAFTYGN